MVKPTADFDGMWQEFVAPHLQSGSIPIGNGQTISQAIRAQTVELSGRINISSNGAANMADSSGLIIAEHLVVSERTVVRGNVPLWIFARSVSGPLLEINVSGEDGPDGQNGAPGAAGTSGANGTGGGNGSDASLTSSSSSGGAGGSGGSGGNGGNGAQGGDGEPGTDGKQLELYAERYASYTGVIVNARGGRGGHGGLGGNGGNGGSAGNGGRGGEGGDAYLVNDASRGGDGGNGGNGANGGRGGDVVIYNVEDGPGYISASVDGGPGGPGGNPGGNGGGGGAGLGAPGGAGGDGGTWHDDDPYGGGGIPGQNGNPGNPGMNAGAQGLDGAKGSIAYRDIGKIDVVGFSNAIARFLPGGALTAALEKGGLIRFRLGSLRD